MHSVRRSATVKRDDYFQLQRVINRAGESFLFKFAVSDYATAEDALLEREYKVFEALDSARALKPLGLEVREDKLTARFQDFSGAPLLEFARQRPLALREFVDVAKQLCAIVGELHALGKILIGITPNSFLRASDDGRLVLADVAFAQEKGADPSRGEEFWLGGAYLPYAAPEVVGRTAHAIDERADLYSLGAIFYDLLCGAPPFDCSDSGEMIQQHLAKRPIRLGARVPGLPSRIETIVMRLLAKRPAERFESVAALERALVVADTPGAGHEVDAHALDAKFVFPEKLYGRDDALSFVGERLEADEFRPGVIFIEGAPGVGKTELARALQRAHAARAGVFCSGKFERAGHALLGGWATALKELASSILTSSPVELANWRVKFAQVLGERGRLLASLVPEWGLVLGEQASTTDEALESDLNRLAMAIQIIAGGFASELPVVLFLDDLQWADASSLRILQIVLSSPAPANLLVLASVRTDDECESSTSPIFRLREELVAKRVSVERLKLQPLGAMDVRDLIEDSFQAGTANVGALVERVLSKTGGSPFFVREFLGTLVRQGLLRFDGDVKAWRWGRNIDDLPVTDNVVDFLVDKIRRLPDEIKSALSVLSCLGSNVSLEDFAAVEQLDAATAKARLALCCDEGLVRCLVRSASEETGLDGAGARYDFVHDRVLEACVALATPEQNSLQHLRIGRVLLGLSQEDLQEKRLYTIVGHFNAAREHVLSESEQLRCVRLNLEAGRTAKRRGAFSQAWGFLASGLFFLRAATQVGSEAANQVLFRSHYELALSLHEEAAECSLLAGHLDAMNELCAAILEHARTALHRVVAYEVLISGYKAQKEFSKAVLVAREFLGELGIKFPKSPSMVHVAAGYFVTRRRLLKHSLASLVEQKELEDPAAKASARIIQAVYAAAYLGEPKLFPLLVYRHVTDSLRYGSQGYSAVTYTAFAVVLCAMGDYQHGFALGQTGLKVLERFNATRLKARVFSPYYFLVYPWGNHLANATPYYDAGMRAGMEHGDFEFACYLMTFQSLARLHTGVPLSELETEFRRRGEAITSLGQERSIIMQSILTQLVMDLRTRSGTPSCMAGPAYSEQDMLPRCLEPLDENLVFHNHLAKLMLSVFFRRTAVGLEAARLGRRHLAGAAFGSYLAVLFTFYESLIHLSEKALTARGRRRLNANRSKLKAWATQAPMNFSNKYHLVEAEWNRSLGRNDVAAEHYEKAIELSQQHSYLHERALAEELAAGFYVQRGMLRLGRYYLRECRRNYQRWGADALVMQLETKHSTTLAFLVSQSEVPGPMTVSRFSDTLDYRTLLRASQAISGQILLPNLLETLLSTILEHAGAQRGALILEAQGKLNVEAVADIEESRAFRLERVAIEDTTKVSQGVVHYAARTEKAVVLADAAQNEVFMRDPYVSLKQTKSLLCAPILYHGRLLGLVYLENNQMTDVFTQTRLEVINLLSSQAAISLANARFHALQLEAQQAKINPHFLFNALSSIAEVSVSDGKTAEAAILKLAGLYRYILTNSAEELVTVEQELLIVQNYLALEKLRFGRQLEYRVTWDESVSDVPLPALLVQPLVENSIRHGITPKLTSGTVTVSAERAGARCCIAVNDDGDGGATVTGGTGFGLKSVQERLALIYGDQYTFSITRSNGYRVELEVPLDVSPLQGRLTTSPPRGPYLREPR